eukprot:COSAG06_NODE_59888_length_272_cov_3.179191_1_plen_34_part_10
MLAQGSAGSDEPVEVVVDRLGRHPDDVAHLAHGV